MTLRIKAPPPLFFFADFILALSNQAVNWLHKKKGEWKRVERVERQAGILKVTNMKHRSVKRNTRGIAKIILKVEWIWEI